MRLPIPFGRASVGNRGLWLLGLIFLCALGTIYWGMGLGEPKSGGLTANQWLRTMAKKKRQLAAVEQDWVRASQAMEKLGTNGLSALAIALYPLKSPDWRTKLWRQLPARIQRKIAPPLTANELAEAAHAIIRRWPRETRHNFARAVCPPWLATIEDPSRSYADRSGLLSLIKELNPPVDLVLPTYRRLIGEPNMRQEALFNLIEYGRPAAPAVPELIMCLGDTNLQVRQFALGGLYSIGPLAKAAVPALENLLDGSLANPAACALWTIERNTNAVLKVLPGCIEDRTGNAAYTLSELGEVARPALPALFAGLKSRHGNVNISSARAIWKIAPENLPEVFPVLIYRLTNGIAGSLANPVHNTVIDICNASELLGDMGTQASSAKWALQLATKAREPMAAEAAQKALARIEAAETAARDGLAK